MPKLFGTFGVRGIANVELTSELALKLGSALAAHLKNRGKVAVGYDNRSSSEALEHAMIAGLTAGGCDAVRLGFVPTPVLSFGIKYFDCKAGVMITGSHNPPEYNGIKFWDSEGAGFSREQEAKIERIFGKAKRVPWNRIGNSYRANALEPYISAIIQRVPKFKHKFKVVVDCANGAGSIVTPRLLTELGCQVISLNCQPDETYPGRPLEPLPENLIELAKTVVAHGADAGIAHDGDADRTLVVDEQGEILAGDRVLALTAMHHLRGRKNPKVVTTVATSLVLDDVASKLRGRVLRTRVGEPEIVEVIRKRDGDIGGEENGGAIFPEWLLCREGIMTAAKFLELLDRRGLSVSEANALLPRYHQLKKKVKCPDRLKPKVLKLLSKRFARYRIDRTEGLRVLLKDGWFILRPSGTEPVFRCFAEAKTRERAEELASEGMRALEESVEKAKRTS